MVRSKRRVDAIGPLPHVTLVEGDFDDSVSLDRALAGVTRAFLLTHSDARAEARQLGFVEAAARAGVRHLVKLSQFAADEDSPVRFLRYHRKVERAIEESGMDWTFLRPNLFMQGFLMFAGLIRDQGKFFAPIGDAAVSMVDVRDNAEVAAAALTGDGHESQIYTLTGPQALTHRQVAEKLSTATGQVVEFVDLPLEAMRAMLDQVGMDPWQAGGLIEDYDHYRRGEAATVADGITRATGQPPRNFEAFAQEYAGAFSKAEETK